MKKILSMLTVIVCLEISAYTSAYANTGDLVNTLYNTDILIYLDGKQIQGYALDGKMMICVEDLQNYGYTVAYDDSIRTLFANKTGETDDDFEPYFERGTVGGIVGYTYETDIHVYINGIETKAENIGGRMAVVAEDISDTDVYSNGMGAYDRYEKYGVSEYSLAHSYNDKERVLYLTTATDIIPSYEEQFATFLDGKDFFFSDCPTYEKPQVLDRKDNDDYTMIFYKWGWFTSIAKFYKNGISMDMHEAIIHYHFQRAATTTIDSGIFSDDGRKCIIEGRRCRRAEIMSYELIDSGTYEIDTDTFIIKKQ